MGMKKEELKTCGDQKDKGEARELDTRKQLEDRVGDFIQETSLVCCCLSLSDGF